MKGIILFLLLLCVFIFEIKGEDPIEGAIYFNTSYDCSEGCSITDANIYEYGILPNSTSDVIFNVTFPFNINNTGAWFHLLSNETFVVYSLHFIGDSGFRIHPNSTLNVTELFLYDKVWLHVHENSSVFAYEASIEELSTLSNYGFIEFFELSTEGKSDIYGDGNSTFNVIESAEFENGTIVFSESTNFTSHETSFENANLQFFIKPYLGDVEFEHVTAYFPYGFIVEDHYTISNSNFSAYFPDELSNVSLILAGQNNLSISNLIFASNKIKFNNTGSPFITFTVTNNATFNGSLEVPGEIVIGDGSNVVLDGNITLHGGLKADVNSSTQIKAVGSLTCGSPIVLIGQSGINSLSVDNAVISAPSITIDKFELNSFGPSLLTGNVINMGAIHVFEKNKLFINGNYTQFENATLGIYNLTNSENRTLATLHINGSAVLAGQIKFNASETTKEFSVTVLKAASSLTGHFTTETYANDVISDKFTAKLHYDVDYVNVTITPKDETKPHHYFGLAWWIWLLIGVGALVVVLTIIGLVVSRRRSQYEPLTR